MILKNFSQLDELEEIERIFMKKTGFYMRKNPKKRLLSIAYVRIVVVGTDAAICTVTLTNKEDFPWAFSRDSPTS